MHNGLHIVIALAPCMKGAERGLKSFGFLRFGVNQMLYPLALWYLSPNAV
jgi:hypothetical protein